MIIIFLFFYGKVYDMLLSDTIRKEQENSAKTAPAIEEIMAQVLQTSTDIQELSFYKELFDGSQDFSSISLQNALASDTFSQEVEAILDDNIIKHLRFYMDLPLTAIEDLNTKTNSSLFASVWQINRTYWNGIFSGTGLSTLHCPEFYLSREEINNYGNMSYTVKKVISVDGISRDCYVSFYYSTDAFLEILNDNLSTDRNVAYIINDRDAIVATTNAALSSTYYLNYETIQDSFMSSNNFLKKNVLNEDIYAGMYNIKQSGWYMVVVILSRPLINTSNIIMIQYILLFLFCIIIALFIALSLSKPITNRLELVTKQMAKARTGPPIPLKKSDMHDEIGDLIDTYNYMSTEMNSLLEERAKSAEDLRIAEFNSLQAQINPHFLYNTMDMINWLATQGRTDKISDAVQNLSRFYKLTLSKRESLSTIGDEIEHASIYIRLQNMRFHDSITFVADIPDDLLEYPIPKLTLQPVIENAILHGIMEKKEKKGHIVLTGWFNNDFIELLISDDGIGITRDKLQMILEGEGKSKRGTNIAIYNTHHRLQVLYGKEYGLFYQSVPGKGTDVSIKLPIKNERNLLEKNNVIPFSAKNILIQTGGDGDSSIGPNELLNYNEKISSETLVLQNIEHISEKLPDEQPLYILTHDVTEDFPAHIHDYFEFTYCCRGSVINVIDNKELVLSSGNAFLLNQNVVQAIKRTDSDALLINVILRKELFENILRVFYRKDNPLALFFRNHFTENNYMYFPMEYNITAQSLLSNIIQEYAENNYCINELLGTLLNDFLMELVSGNEYSYIGIDSKTTAILNLVEKHALRESAEQIAFKLSMTSLELSDYLKKHTGQHLTSIINRFKINYALTLIQRSDTNIFDITNACGFSDHKEFSKVFTEFYGLSPEEYRKDILV